MISGLIEIAPSAPVVTAQQVAGSDLPYRFDISSVCARAWQANAYIKAGTVLRPTCGNGTGFVYPAQATGQSGEIEPAWATTPGTPVQDGSLTLTTAIPPAGGQDTIESVSATTVNPPDQTLTVGAPTNDEFTLGINIGGGTAGETYVILILATMASEVIWPIVLYLTILPP